MQPTKRETNREPYGSLSHKRAKYNALYDIYYYALLLINFTNSTYEQEQNMLEQQ